MDEHLNDRQTDDKNLLFYIQMHTEHFFHEKVSQCMHLWGFFNAGPLEIWIFLMFLDGDTLLLE